MAHPRLKLLYVTPESLFKRDYEACFRKAYEQQQIARIVVDEAHVLHEWGNGFRPVRSVGAWAHKLTVRSTRRLALSSGSTPAFPRL